MLADQHFRPLQTSSATRLTDALKAEGAGCTTMTWPQHADHQANAELLGSHLVGGEARRQWSCSPAPRTAIRMRSAPLRGEDYVRHLVRIAREIADDRGEPPRLYVVTTERPDRVARRRRRTWSRPACVA